MRPRTASAADHLKDISDRHVDIALGLAVEELCAFDDNEMGGQIDSPCQGGSGAQDANLAAEKQSFHKFSVGVAETGVMQTNAELQRLFQRRISGRGDACDGEEREKEFLHGKDETFLEGETFG